MHSAWWSRLSLVLSDIPPWGPPPGWSLLRHVCAAFRNAGDCATPSGMLGPSGKFGTPFERMHFANASRLDRFEAVVPVGVVEDPQAASVRVQVAAAVAIVSSAVGRRCRRVEFRLGCRLLIVSMSWASGSECGLGGSGWRGEDAGIGVVRDHV